MKAFPQVLQKFFRSLMCLARMCLLLASLVESFIPHSSHKKSLAGIEKLSNMVIVLFPDEPLRIHTKGERRRNRKKKKEGDKNV